MVVQYIPRWIPCHNTEPGKYQSACYWQAEKQPCLPAESGRRKNGSVTSLALLCSAKYMQNSELVKIWQFSVSHVENLAIFSKSVSHIH